MEDSKTQYTTCSSHIVLGDQQQREQEQRMDASIYQ